MQRRSIVLIEDKSLINSLELLKVRKDVKHKNSKDILSGMGV